MNKLELDLKEFEEECLVIMKYYHVKSNILPEFTDLQVVTIIHDRTGQDTYVDQDDDKIIDNPNGFYISYKYYTECLERVIHALANITYQTPYEILKNPKSQFVDDDCDKIVLIYDQVYLSIQFYFLSHEPYYVHTNIYYNNLKTNITHPFSKVEINDTIILRY